MYLNWVFQPLFLKIYGAHLLQNSRWLYVWGWFLAFFPKVVQIFSPSCLFHHDLHSVMILLESDASRNAFISFLALEVLACLNWLKRVQSFIIQELIWKISTLCIWFLHQTNHGIQGWFCGWCARSFPDSGLELLVSQCHLSTHSISRKLDLSKVALFFSMFSDPKVWKSWLVCEKEAVCFFPSLRLRANYWSVNFTSDNGIKYCLDSSKILAFLVCIPFATLIYTSPKIATASIVSQGYDLFSICSMILLSDLHYNSLLRYRAFAFTAYYPTSYFLQDGLLISVVWFPVSLTSFISLKL